MLMVTALGVGSDRLEVKPVTGHPDSAVIRVASGLTVHVREQDIDLLAAALAEARELLQANAGNESISKEN